MLRLEIEPITLWDEDNEEFIKIKGTSLELEHSLLSISKWEAKWKKPFLSSEKTYEETIDYIRCMTITKNVDDLIYKYLKNEHYKQINEYISDPMSAYVFYEDSQKKGGVKEQITSEVIYYWMGSFGIPYQFEKWNFNRLFTLIKIYNMKNAPPKKMGRKELAERNRMLNAQRKAKMHTKG